MSCRPPVAYCTCYKGSTVVLLFGPARLSLSAEVLAACIRNYHWPMWGGMEFKAVGSRPPMIGLHFSESKMDLLSQTLRGKQCGQHLILHFSSIPASSLSC